MGHLRMLRPFLPQIETLEKECSCFWLKMLFYRKREESRRRYRKQKKQCAQILTYMKNDVPQGFRSYPGGSALRGATPCGGWGGNWGAGGGEGSGGRLTGGRGGREGAGWGGAGGQRGRDTDTVRGGRMGAGLHWAVCFQIKEEEEPVGRKCLTSILSAPPPLALQKKNP